MKYVMGVVLGFASALLIAAQAASPKLGVVQLTEVFEKNPRRAAAEVRLNEHKSRSEEALRALRQRARELEQQLQLIEKNTTRHAEVERELVRLQSDFNYEEKRAADEYRNLVRTQRESLLREIRQVIDRFAQQNGYALILQRELTMSSDELTWVSVLYVDRAHDLTAPILAELSKE
jgi:outer membrane protein